MSSSVTKRFSNAFDSKNEEHLRWVYDLHLAFKNAPTSKDPKAVVKVIDANPFKIKVRQDEMLDFAMVEFSLCMKYAIDVMEGKAIVPTTPFA